MPKPRVIALGRDIEIPILYEDRSALAIDKPAGWLLAPSDWDRTGRNLQLALNSSIAAGDFWARSRNLRFLRFIHRLDAETTGVLLFARSSGAIPRYSKLFESRAVRKTYFAVVEGLPPADAWVCKAPIAPDLRMPGRMRIDIRNGKEAETRFSLEDRAGSFFLIKALPITGRTHQIRLHLLESGLKIAGDPIYGAAKSPSRLFSMALRAAALEYVDPFTQRRVIIQAPLDAYLREFGFCSVRK